MDSRRTSLPPALTLALCGGYFLVLLDVTVVNITLPSIRAGLDASAAGLAWTVDAYATPLAALLLASGAVGDRLGHRRVVIAGFLGFGAASVVCATAQSVAQLTAGRAVQGVAAALMLPGTLALLTRAAPDERARTRIVALWAAVGGAALPAGPVAGGLLVRLGWQAVFWVNVPVIAAATAALLTLRGPGPERTSGRVDWAGAGLLTVLIGGAVTAIIEAREAPAVAGGAVAAGVAAAVAMALTTRRTSERLLRVESAAKGPLTRACTVAGLMNLCSLGVLFVLTQVFQDVRGLSPLAAGLLLLPGMLPLPLLGPAAGRLVERAGPWPAAALALGTGAVGFLLVAVSLTGALAVLIVGLALWGSGLGVLAPAVVTAALRTSPAAPGMASGASNTARQVGGAIGVAVAGAVAGGPGQAHFTERAGTVVYGAAVVFAAAAAFAVRTGVTGRTPPVKTASAPSRTVSGPR